MMPTNSTSGFSAVQRGPGVIHSISDHWKWYYIFMIVVILEVQQAFKVFRIRPKNLKLLAAPTYFGNWITGVLYTFKMRSMVFNGCQNTKESIWAIPARDKFHICVTSEEMIKEFNNASQHVISLQGAVHELFPPHELYGGMPAGDKVGNLGLSQSIFRNDLRMHLSEIQPLISEEVMKGFEREFKTAKTNKDGWRKIPLYKASYRITARLNSLIIVGKKLSSNEEFSTLLQRYLGTATVVEEVLRMIPLFLKPIIGNTLMRYFGGRSAMRKQINDAIQERIHRSPIEKPENNMDCIQWSINRSRKASLHDLTSHILAILFASTHQIPVLISFAIYRLCLHPEYLAPLREEVQRGEGNFYDPNNQEMPLLDSFLKEVARLHPITVVSMPHKVQAPFTFSDGAHIPSGNWVCIPQQAIMQNENLYPEASVFQGFRFVDWKDDGTPSKYATSKTRFSHPAHLFPFWGTLKNACPARFYVSMAAKMMVAHFIINYDAKLANPNAPSTFHWGLSTVPNPRLSILVREREEKSL